MDWICSRTHYFDAVSRHTAYRKVVFGRPFLCVCHGVGMLNCEYGQVWQNGGHKLELMHLNRGLLTGCLSIARILSGNTIGGTHLHKYVEAQFNTSLALSAIIHCVFHYCEILNGLSSKGPFQKCPTPE